MGTRAEKRQEEEAEGNGGKLGTSTGLSRCCKQSSNLVEGRLVYITDLAPTGCTVLSQLA